MDKIMLMKKFEATMNTLRTIPGFKEFEDWLLNETDFITAPASTRFHGACEGGLLDHSIRVMEILVKNAIVDGIKWDRPESPYLIGLFHDLCKVNFYKPIIKKIKNSSGECVDSITYEIDEQFPTGGHGSKSVSLLKDFIKVTKQEELCICHHMGAYGERNMQSAYSDAKNKYPEILTVSRADELAATLETREEKGFDNSNYARLFNLAIDIESEEK